MKKNKISHRRYIVPIKKMDWSSLHLCQNFAFPHQSSRFSIFLFFVHMLNHFPSFAHQRNSSAFKKGSKAKSLLGNETTLGTIHSSDIQTVMWLAWFLAHTRQTLPNNSQRQFGDLVLGHLSWNWMSADREDNVSLVLAVISSAEESENLKCNGLCLPYCLHRLNSTGHGFSPVTALLPAAQSPKWSAAS